MAAIVLLPATELSGQSLLPEQETGRPLLQHYGSRTYGASPQNWALLEDAQGILLLGNNDALLEYDGSSWQRIPGTRGGIFSLAMDRRGVVYAGGTGDLGFLEPDARGVRRFVSLLGQVPAGKRNFGVIRSVHVLGETVLFQGRRDLFFLRKGRLSHLPLGNAYLRAYVAGDRYLLRIAGRGLCAWQGDSLRLLPAGDAFRDETIACILPFQGERLLIGTSKNGIWSYDPNSGERRRPAGFESIDQQVVIHELYHGTGIPGGYAFGTLGGGVFLTDRQGRIVRHIDRGAGLADHTVHLLYLDRQDGLWVAMNRGLDRLSLRAPFEYWDESLGLDAAVLSVARLGKVLYAGTNLGLYALRAPQAPGHPARFEPVGTLRDQVFALDVVSPPGAPPVLLLSTGSGLYALGADERLQPLNGGDRTPVFAVSVARNDPGLLYAGGDGGLFRLRFANGRWTAPEKVPGVDAAVRSLGADAGGALWIGTRNRGFLRLDQAPGQPLRALAFDSLAGRPAMGSHHIFRDGDSLFFRSSTLGTFRFDAPTGQFRRYEPAGPSIPVWIGAAGPRPGSRWLWTPGPTGLRLEWVRPGAGADSGRIYRPFDMLPHPAELLQGGIYPENETVTWLGGSEALYRFDGAKLPEEAYFWRDFPVLIRRVHAGRDSLLSAAGSGWGPAPALRYRDNSVRFAFAAAGFERPEATRFRHKLEGYDRDWSAWSAHQEKEYTNLPAGSYAFRVQARNVFGHEAEATAFSFVVWPPWYQTWWAFLLYLILGIGLLAALVRQITKQQDIRLARELAINERLRAADRMKDQFIANTSHELRTPLNGIIGLSESLLDHVGQFPEDKQREDLALVIASGKRLAGLVNDLLDFSRLREGELNLRLRPVDLHSLADIVLRISQPLTTGKDLRLLNAVPRDLPAALADEDRLQQILLNLVGNAVKFTDKGYVKVGAHRLPPAPAAGKDAPASIEVYVEDTGIGIAPDKQEAIFNAFEQADGSIEREYGGTGLGLAISRRLVELHGGTIGVRSEPGKGATFRFSLPVTDKQPAPRAQGAVQPAAARPLPMPAEATSTLPDMPFRARVLIVDDEPINHHVLRNHLAGSPFETVSALNGDEAMERLAAGPPFDLVLLDLMMPRMNGYEVCRRIRERYLPSELPVIMITAKNQVTDLVEGFAVGANDYLAKPFSRDELLARVRTQLDLQRIFEITGRFVPNEFLHALGRERITDVNLGDHMQREVTVLFTDIRNYTTLAESMSPEDNFRFVNSYHRRMGPVIRSHRGFVNQYLGDAIMAIFPGSPSDALQAAVDMQARLRTYNEERQARGHSPIRVGMGLHTGPLIMGIIGDEHRMDAATIADTVNTASRIESLTKHYGASILLSGESLKVIRAEREGEAAPAASAASTFVVRYLGQVQVKGKNEALGLYECIEGDEPGVAGGKKATLTAFDRAMNAYLSADFATAADSFHQLSEQSPGDRVAAHFEAKARQFLTEAPPEDWSGIEVMDRK